VTTRKRILIAAGGVLALAAGATIGMRSYRTQRSITAWRVRHQLPAQLAGVKFHVPPSLSPYQPRFEPQGRWWFIRSNQSKEGEAFYVIEANARSAPDPTSSSSSSGDRRPAKTVAVTLAGKNGLCTESERHLDLDVAGPWDPHFISIDCSFSSRLRVSFFGRARGVSEFYQFIQTAE
jgi:hypothetical protein